MPFHLLLPPPLTHTISHGRTTTAGNLHSLRRALHISPISAGSTPCYPPSSPWPWPSQDPHNQWLHLLFSLAVFHHRDPAMSTWPKLLPSVHSPESRILPYIVETPTFLSLPHTFTWQRGLLSDEIYGPPSSSAASVELCRHRRVPFSLPCPSCW